MSVPVIENIAENLKDSLNAITVANGFNQTIKALRVRQIDYNNTGWGDLDCLIVQGEATKLTRVTGCVSWQQFFYAAVAVIDSEKSTTPIDTRKNQICADIIKKLSADLNRGGLALDTDFQECEFYEEDDGGPGGLTLKISVDYRVLEDDPYTKA